MIRVVRSELTSVDADGVLRSVNSDLSADSPASRQVELAMGPEAVERAQAMGEVPVGGAVITPGGDLQAQFVVHAVTQSPVDPVGTESVKTALLNGLRRAREWGLEALALPPLGTGAGNLEAEESASVMIPVIQDHMTSSDSPKETIIVVASEYEEDVFLRAVEFAGRQNSAQES